MTKCTISAPSTTSTRGNGYSEGGGGCRGAEEGEGRGWEAGGRRGHGYDHLLDNPVIFFSSIEGVTDESRNITRGKGLIWNS